MRVSDSFWRGLIAIGFNAAVAGVLRLFGASTTTSWFTFLALTGVAGLAEIGRTLESIEGKLDAVLEAQQYRDSVGRRGETEKE